MNTGHTTADSGCSPIRAKRTIEWADTLTQRPTRLERLETAKTFRKSWPRHTENAEASRAVFRIGSKRSHGMGSMLIQRSSKARSRVPCRSFFFFQLQASHLTVAPTSQPPSPRCVSCSKDQDVRFNVGVSRIRRTEQENTLERRTVRIIQCR